MRVTNVLPATLLTLAAACGSGVSITGTPTTGTLTVRVSQPLAGKPTITVTGPGGFMKTISATTSMYSLETGQYSIAAEPVTASGITSAGIPATQTIDVVVNVFPTATVFYCIVPCPWSSRASLPSPGDQVAVVSTNGKLYAIGGADSAFRHRTVVAYDPVADAWTAKAPMPTPRGAPAAGVVNGIVYVIGGNTDTGTVAPVTTVEAYDPAADTWSAKAPMPTTRGGFAVGVVNGILYAVGGSSVSCVGLNCTETLLPLVEAYDPVSDSWTIKAPMPTARAGLAVAVVNGILYAVGGFTQSQPLGTVEAYDPSTNHWTSRSALPTPRDGLAAGALNGSVVAIGGFDRSFKSVNIVESYDPASNRWRNEQPMPIWRARQSAGVIGNTLYAVGGLETGFFLTTVEAYTP